MAAEVVVGGEGRRGGGERERRERREEGRRERGAEEREKGRERERGERGWVGGGEERGEGEFLCLHETVAQCCVVILPSQSELRWCAVLITTTSHAGLE